MTTEGLKKAVRWGVFLLLLDIYAVQTKESNMSQRGTHCYLRVMASGQNWSARGLEEWWPVTLTKGPDLFFLAISESPATVVLGMPLEADSSWPLKKYQKRLWYIKQSYSLFLSADVSLMSGGGGGLVTKSHLTLTIPWTRAHQLSMGFPR